MPSDNLDRDGDLQSQGAAQRVYRGIMRDLEARRMVPGQRLVETELAEQYGVGRNAVREAIQRLAGRGIVDVSRNRSPAIRHLDLAEVHEILDVAAAMTALVARSAAAQFVTESHGAMLNAAVQELDDTATKIGPAAFGRARRHFYRALLTISGNRELQRIFPSIGMHIIHSQLQSQDTRTTRIADYRQICEAVAANDVEAADRAARDHVAHILDLIHASDAFRG